MNAEKHLFLEHGARNPQRVDRPLVSVVPNHAATVKPPTQPTRVPLPEPVKVKPGTPVLAPPKCEVACRGPATMVVKVGGDATPPDEDESRRRLLPFLPSWMVSGCLHAAAIIVLALLTLPLPEGTSLLVVVNSLADEASEQLQELDAKVEMEFEPAPESLDATPVAPDAVAETEVSPLADPSALVSVESSVAFESHSVSEVSAMFGRDGLALREIGGGSKAGGSKGGGEGQGKGNAGKGGKDGSTSFFGVRTTGNRFVYVVDNSVSMSLGRFETAVYELQKSVDELQPEHQFHVVFFSDGAYPMFHPETGVGLVRASPENKQKLRSWLATVHRCLGTNGEDAMAMAFALKPDVVYLLGDGMFLDNTVNITLARKGAPVTIQTMGFDMTPKESEGFVAIAQAFSGTFRNVAVPPEMVAMETTLKRPVITSRTGVWGLKLGAAPQIKK